MMDTKVMEDLIIKVSSKMHEKWCEEELRAFFNRMQEAQKNGVTDFKAVCEAACYKNGKLRNEFEIDEEYCALNSVDLRRSLTDFDFFRQLVDAGGVNVKRFTNRNLTQEEIEKANENGHVNYKNGQENILRAFKSLSRDSKRENLDAAIGACNVYIQLCEAGVSIEQMQNDATIINGIGIAVHYDWLKRNINHSDDSLKVSYSELDDWTKQQDLTVFSTLLRVIAEDLKLYHVDKKEGAVIPDFLELEANLLANMRKRTM